MKLPAFEDILKMSKEKINITLAPIRARKAKRQAELEMCKLDEQIAVVEADVTESCTKDEILFSNIIEKLDRIAILERKKKQYEKILAELFPDKE